MSTRRDFLKAGALTGVGLFLPFEGGVTSAFANTPSKPIDGTKLAKFVDSLPMPAVARPIGQLQGMPYYRVAMQEFRQKMHRDLPATTLWGYNASYPGPTIEARRGQPIKVDWLNDLPSKHMFPIDPTIHGSGDGVPDVHTVVHLHGAKIMPDSDGYPEAWFTRGFAKTGPFFTNKTYTYPNDQQATTLWYHDHGIGITRLNVLTGMAALYILRDDWEDSLNLPKGRYEIPLFFQDHLFNSNGSILFPVQDPNLGDPGFPGYPVPPIWMPEYFGDTCSVNGKISPFLEVEPRKYRFRFLNGSNARFYHVKLVETTPTGISLEKPGPVFNQIGTDGGLLPTPVPLTDFLFAPAERLDIVIDFSKSYGKNFVLTNDAAAPYPSGDDPTDPSTPGPVQLLMFKVNQPLRDRDDDSSLPKHLSTVPLISAATAVKQRNLTLTELDSVAGNPIVGQLGTLDSFDPLNPSLGLMWSDPVTENPKAGSTEQWNIYNLTGDAHPIHVHLVQFQVLNRQNILVDGAGNLILDKNGKPQPDPASPPQPPAPNERPAWKDTIKTFPATITRIIAKFELPTGANVKHGDKVRYVWHCHILDHEDNEMMRPYDVIV